MSPTTALQGRVKELSTSLGQIQPLVDRLRDFTASIGQGDEARLELGSEIHSRLKEAEQELELLRVEAEALETGSDSRRKAPAVHGQKEAERERVISMVGRLAEDLKRTRGEFRTAQLQAKRKAELAKRQERELLLSRSHSSEKKQPTEKFTQDDLVLNASNDVTSALRRTHQLMQAELSRSQFAQSTLEQSTAAISSLSESYSGLDTLLSSSRNLANSLLRSQKSDTWYLETAFYVLIATISWLLFRRVFYGPLWWLLWLPLKFIGRVAFATLGAAGLSTTAAQSASQSLAGDVSTAIHQMATAATTGTVTASITAWEQEPSAPIDSDRVIDKIGDMVEQEKQSSVDIDDVTPEERARQAELPRNTKRGFSKTTIEGEDGVEVYRSSELLSLVAPPYALLRTPGTGKTSTILALAKSLFGPALYRSRILELNASDERGIGIVRDKVKNFARAQLSQPTGLDAAYRAQYPCPPFKIIILDEADSMTQDAQSALRRTMETYSRITRFCLVCNYVTRIIEPLASRCSKFRFKMLDTSAAGERISNIAEREGLQLEDGVIDTLIRCGEGDLRRAITYLQSAARLVGATKPPAVKDADDDAEMTDAGSNSSVITVRSIEEIAGVLPEDILDSLVEAMQPKSGGSVYEAVSGVITDLVADGWSATQLVGQLYRRVVLNEAIPDIQKNKIVMLFSEMDKRLVDGSDEHLSMLDLALRIAGVLSGN
ncbi:Sec20 [Penicillium verrucosum]|uniref:Sec20 n=1 Tax=Penicillium verrucosum TaxID=60171 RepID=UPI00254591A4|nr:Sec20 [Penicillium verrucosum]KAJ5922530.1 Sec20 [Penicillium verrucosum]